MAYDFPDPEGDIESANLNLKYFPSNSRDLIGSGVTYKFSGGYEVAFTPGKREIVLKLSDDLYTEVDASASFMPQLAQPEWAMKGFTLWAICHLPVYQTFHLPRVPKRDDGHEHITQQALASIPEIQAAFAANPASFFEIPKQVSYQDVPDPQIAIDANLMSLLHGNIADPDELLGRHGLRPVYVVPPETSADQTQKKSTLHLATQEETLAGIRTSMDTHLQALHDATLESKSASKDFEPQQLTDYLKQLDSLAIAIKQNDTETALRILEDFRSVCDFGQMRDFIIPDENRAYLLAHPKNVALLAKAHLSLREKIIHFLDISQSAQNSDDRAKVVAAYRIILRHFRPEMRDHLGSGLYASLAERDLHLAYALHLGQDSRAHCNDWTNDFDGDGFGDVCADSVGVNAWGLGPLHSATQDSLNGPNGMVLQDRAFRISQEILRLMLIDDPDQFISKKIEFLDHYFPVHSQDFQPNENYLQSDNTTQAPRG